MKSGEDLFQLIQTLSQAEKRYFSIFATRHVIGNRNEYLLLFDIVDAQTKSGIYDEESVKKKIGKNINSNISSAKHYLYDLILRSMRSFNEYQTSYDYINRRIDDIKFLMAKGLFNKCSQLISSSKKICYQIEYYYGLLEILSCERKMFRFAPAKNSVEHLNLITKEEQNILHIISNELLYRDFNDKSFLLGQIENSSNKTSIRNRAKAILENEFMSDHSQNNSFLSKYSYYAARAECANVLGDSKQAVLHAKKNVELFERHPIIQKEQIKPYINALQTFANYCFLANDLNEFPNLFKKLKTIKTARQEEEIAWTRFKYNLEVAFYAQTNKWEDALHLIPEIEDWLLKFNHRLPLGSKIAWIYNIGQICFMNSYYEKSLDWFNRIILENWKGIRIDLQDASHIFQILIHCQMENYTVAQSLLYNFKRHYLKRNKSDLFQKYIFTFVSKYIKARSKLEQYKLIESECERFNAVSTIADSKIIGIRDLKSWLDKIVSEKYCL